MELSGVDHITKLLVLFLDTQSRRAEMISSNIANADTPGYLAKELDFADYLRNAAYSATSSNSNGFALPGPAFRGPSIPGLAVPGPRGWITASFNGGSPFQAQPALFEPGERPVVVEATGRPIGIDGNSVDMEHEMAQLADAGGAYTTGVQLLQARFRTLRMAIKEGR